jgi:uncharacterized protein
LNKQQLAQYAVARTLFAPTNLTTAIETLGYVQADPIRAPARAQDLILRHRVRDYRADDLETHYPSLDVFEDMLHNYGFFPERHVALLYPRKLSTRWQTYMDEHRALRRKVLRFLADNAEAHPRDVEKFVGAGQRVNGWGGTSSASTLMLEGLHRDGMARVVRREAGQRVYARATPVRAKDALSATARGDALIALLVNLYAPLPMRSLTHTISMCGAYKPDIDYKARIQAMIRRGALATLDVDGLTYVLPADEAVEADIRDEVRLLAPFDPLVWDRRRFEHLWQWPYRFEAYTPAAKRQFGYYALPLLWRENVIGWANVEADRDRGAVKIDCGYVNSKPRGAAFRAAFEAEVARVKVFLRC